MDGVDDTLLGKKSSLISIFFTKPISLKKTSTLHSLLNYDIDNVYWLDFKL